MFERICLNAVRLFSIKGWQADRLLFLFLEGTAHNKYVPTPENEKDYPVVKTGHAAVRLSLLHSCAELSSWFGQVPQPFVQWLGMYRLQKNKLNF